MYWAMRFIKISAYRFRETIHINSNRYVYFVANKIVVHENIDKCD